MFRRWLALAVLVLAAGCSAPAPPVGITVGYTAPDVAGTDANGQAHRLSQHRGKVVVLDFWATWCPPCVAMVPHEKLMARRLGGKPFTFFGVSADDDPDRLKQFLQSHQIDWPNVFDGRGGKLSREWEIDGWPTVVVIDQKGVIRYRFDGRPHPDELDRAVEKLLSDAGSGSR